MTMLSLQRSEPDDATLVRRARRGDRRAHRLFSRRHAARVVEVVQLLVDSGPQTTALSAAVIDAWVADGAPGDDALLLCAVQVLAPVAGDRGLARLVLALVELEGRDERWVADLVGRTVTEVRELLATARAEIGAARSRGRDCRGWPLAHRRDRLTSDEREAADGHLRVCRACRVRLDDQRRTRERLVRSGAAVTAVVLADVVALSVPAGGAVGGLAGLTSLALGKAGVAAVGVTALAVATTSAGVALARSAPGHAGHPTVVRPEQPSTATTPSAGPGTGSATVPAGHAGRIPAVTPTARQAPVELPPLAPGSTAPSSLLPSSLPTVLPTATLPTTLLPGVQPTSLLPTPLTSATSLLGATTGLR